MGWVGEGFLASAGAPPAISAVVASMPGLVLSASDRALLAPLVGERIDQLVWDLDAVYLRRGERVAVVSAPIHRRDRERILLAGEIAPVRAFASKLAADVPRHRRSGPQLPRRGDLDGRARGSRSRAACTSPIQDLVHPRDDRASGRTALPCDRGVVVSVDEGSLPAVLFHEEHAFPWPGLGLFTQRDVAHVAGEHFELIPLGRSPDLLRPSGSPGATRLPRWLPADEGVPAPAGTPSRRSGEGRRALSA